MRAHLLAVALAAATLLGPAAVADGGAPVGSVDVSALPLEDFAAYDPQTTCTKRPKPGTVALGEHLVATYGGSGGAVNRACSGPSTSEHKDGRAVDWTLDADDPAQRRMAKAFLAAALAPDAAGNPAALARRMGIMYIIWSDRSYAAYRQFAKQPYLSSGCRSKRRCSKTLRHRDHMHISLSRAGARGLTSFYAGLVPQSARRVVVPVPDGR